MYRLIIYEKKISISSFISSGLKVVTKFLAVEDDGLSKKSPGYKIRIVEKVSFKFEQDRYL